MKVYKPKLYDELNRKPQEYKASEQNIYTPKCLRTELIEEKETVDK